MGKLLGGLVGILMSGGLVTGGLVVWWTGGWVEPTWFLSTFCLVLGKIQMKIPTNCNILSTEKPTDSGRNQCRQCLEKGGGPPLRTEPCT